MASRVVRARLDDASARALKALMDEGRNESEAVRAALEEAHIRRRRREAIAEEVRRLANDPADRAVSSEVLEDMESIGAEWPDP